MTPTTYQRELLTKLAAESEGWGVVGPRDWSQEAGAEFTLALDEMVSFGWAEIAEIVTNYMVPGDLYYSVRARITDRGRDVLAQSS